MIIDSGRLLDIIVTFSLVQPLITIQNEYRDLGFECYREEKRQKYSPSKQSHIRDRNKNCRDSFGLVDVFPCNDSRDTYIKFECLTCGKIVNRPVCPNHRDDTKRFFTCSECLNFTQSCHNGGKMYCPHLDSYGVEMECRCRDGFTGDYCEIKIIKVYRMCECSDDLSYRSLPLCHDTSAVRCQIELFDGNTSCICNNISRNAPPDNVPNCSNITEERIVEEEPSLSIINKSDKAEITMENRAYKGYTWNVFCFLLFILLLLYVP